MRAPKSEITKRILANSDSVKDFWEALGDRSKAVRLNGKAVYLRRLPGIVSRRTKRDADS